MDKKVFIVIPAKDEGKRIGEVIKETQSHGYHNIVVVDDGSTDNTSEVARDLNAYVLKHIVNLGPGAATQTGITYTLKSGADIIVTIDADTQHYPDDIDALIAPLLNSEYDLVIGSRFLQRDNRIPFIRVVYNKIANVVTFLVTGTRLTDSQTGMKAFSKEFIGDSELKYNGFEFCIEIIRFIGLNRSRYIEVPIKVKYSKETMEKGQNFNSGLKMIAKLIRGFF